MQELFITEFNSEFLKFAKGIQNFYSLETEEV